MIADIVAAMVSGAMAQRERLAPRAASWFGPMSSIVEAVHASQFDVTVTQSALEHSIRVRAKCRRCGSVTNEKISHADIEAADIGADLMTRAIGSIGCYCAELPELREAVRRG